MSYKFVAIWLDVIAVKLLMCCCRRSSLRRWVIFQQQSSKLLHKKPYLKNKTQ